MQCLSVHLVTVVVWYIVNHLSHFISLGMHNINSVFHQDIVINHFVNAMGKSYCEAHDFISAIYTLHNCVARESWTGLRSCSNIMCTIICSKNWLPAPISGII